MQFGFVSGCPLCPIAERTPLTWYRQRIGDGWVTSEVSRDDPKLVERIPRAFLPLSMKQLPDVLRERLSRMRVAAVGFVKRVTYAADTFVAGDAGRDCVWSLREGARSRCESPKARSAADPPQPVAANGCELAIDPPDHETFPGAIPITCGATLIATAYDLSMTEWALMLPDGQFTGSAHATEYLAFYARDGSVVGENEVGSLRTTPAVVAAAIAESLEQ